MANIYYNFFNIEDIKDENILQLCKEKINLFKQSYHSIYKNEKNINEPIVKEVVRIIENSDDDIEKYKKLKKYLKIYTFQTINYNCYKDLQKYDDTTHNYFLLKDDGSMVKMEFSKITNETQNIFLCEISSNFFSLPEIIPPKIDYDSDLDF
tara:strand:- start:482 stop:937 length:456 start_codon:yes stop_codon:yes gene_type:complete